MGQKTSHLGPVQYAVITLATATALIHIVLAFQFENGPDILFILNGIGYLGLTALLYIPIDGILRYRTVIRWALIAYTAVTIVLWIFVGARNPIAYVDKVIEIALIIVLWLDGQRSANKGSLA